MFDNFVPLFPEDVADQIVYCCTRPRHVQISDISSYATNQSYFSMKGVPPVARMGMSLGADNQNSDWSNHQQGWGNNMWGGNMSGGMMGGNMMGGNMMNNNQGRSSPRGNNMNYPANFNFGNNSPRSYGQSGNGGSGGFGGSAGGSFGNGSMPFGPTQMGGRNSPRGSPHGSPRMGHRM